MRKVFKWLGLSVAGLVGLMLLAGASLYGIGSSRFAARFEPPSVRPPAMTTDAAALARGEHLARAVADCAGCHGADLGGQKFDTPPMLATMGAPNLTRGSGGIAATYTDADWDRAVRHGVGKDGRRLIIMPSNRFAHLSDADFAAIVAYVRSVPPVDRVLPARKAGPLGAVLLAAGMFHFSGEGIDPGKIGGAAPTPAPTAEYGDYLVEIANCRECHTETLAGTAGGMGPPPAPNLTPAGDLGSWTRDDFVRAIRTGVTPDHKVLDGNQMPWPDFKAMTDEELSAVWTYIHSLAPLPGPNLAAVRAKK